MAVTKTIYSDVGAIRMALIVTETATSIDNNTSTLSWQLVGYQTATTSWYANYYHAVSVSINGSAVYTRANTTSSIINIGAGTTVGNPFVIASGTTTVAHNSDGTKSCALAFSCAYKWSSTYTWSSSGSVTLTVIARASTPTFSASSVNIGSALTITTNRASSSFTHTLSYSFGAATGTIATDVGASCSWTPPQALLSEIPDDESGTCTITCTTYNGSTLIGTTTATVTLTVSSACISIGQITFEEAGDVPDSWGVYIYGKSRLKIGITPTAGTWGARIVSCAITCNGSTTTIYGHAGYYTTTTGYLTTGSTITCVLTDSRGRTGTTTASYTLNSYTIPDITLNSAYRVASNGSTTRDDSGAYIYVSATCTITAIGENSGSAKVWYKKTSAYSYSSWSNATEFTTSVTKTYWFSADISSSYNVKVEVSDYFGSVFAATTVLSESVMINIRNTGKGIGIGKVSEADNMIDSAWGFRTPLDITAGYGLTYATHLLSTYTASSSSSSGEYWGYRFLGQNLIDVVCKKTITSLATTTAWGALYFTGSAYSLTMPSDIPVTVSDAMTWQPTIQYNSGFAWAIPLDIDPSTRVFRMWIVNAKSETISSCRLLLHMILAVTPD